MVKTLPHQLRKQRGSRTMGYGRVGQHRKSGGRGGKGRAGGRKHFWIRTMKHEPERYRKVGFNPPSALGETPRTINADELRDLAVEVYGIEAVDTGTGPIELNLTELGYDKLLGRGKIKIPLRLMIQAYSARALEKVEAADGEIKEFE
jgi:large subunit ribosomal protein L15